MSDIISEVDQALAAHKQLAKLVAAYFWNLVGEGVPMERASDITIAYQAEIMAAADSDTEE